jgi:hypothetical protein
MPFSITTQFQESLRQALLHSWPLALTTSRFACACGHLRRRSPDSGACAVPLRRSPLGAPMR